MTPLQAKRILELIPEEQREKDGYLSEGYDERDKGLDSEIIYLNHEMLENLAKGGISLSALADVGVLIIDASFSGFSPHLRGDEDYTIKLWPASYPSLVMQAVRTFDGHAETYVNYRITGTTDKGNIQHDMQKLMDRSYDAGEELSFAVTGCSGRSNGLRLDIGKVKTLASQYRAGGAER